MIGPRKRSKLRSPRVGDYFITPAGNRRSSVAKRYHKLFRVNAKPDTLIQHTPTNIGGEIWLEIDGTSFPAEGWTDFIVTLLCDWNEKLESLGSGAGRETLRVMEGPDTVVLEAQPGDRVRATATFQGQVIADAVLEQVEIVSELRRAGREILDACDARGLTNDDVDNLRRALSSVH